jgi:hypothetical protein
MASEVTGKVFKIYPIEEIKEKQKQSFVIEVAGQYPYKLALECWGKTVEYSSKLKEGQQVTVSYDVSSREWSDKWFTSAKAFKIVANGQGASNPVNEPNNNTNGSQETDGLPF